MVAATQIAQGRTTFPRRSRSQRKSRRQSIAPGANTHQLRCTHTEIMGSAVKAGTNRAEIETFQQED